MFESRKVNDNFRAHLPVNITKASLPLTKTDYSTCHCAGTRSSRALGLVGQPGHQFRECHENTDDDGHADHER